MTGEYIPPAGWSQPDNRGHVTFTLAQPPTMNDKAPEREGFECFFVGLTDRYTRWTYRPTDTPTQQARLAVIDLQRSLAMLDVGLNILKDVTPITQEMFREREQAIAEVVVAKNRMTEMQDVILAALPEDVREQVVRKSRIGAEHLRGR